MAETAIGFRSGSSKKASWSKRRRLPNPHVPRNGRGGSRHGRRPGGRIPNDGLRLLLLPVWRESSTTSPGPHAAEARESPGERKSTVRGNYGYLDGARREGRNGLLPAADGGPQANQSPSLPPSARKQRSAPAIR